MAELKKMATTAVERVPCNMCPDPCGEDDYRVTGESTYDEGFDSRVHRGRGAWLLELGDLRETWAEFRSLQEVVDHLEEGGVSE
jgi:hypothetical protein